MRKENRVVCDIRISAEQKKGGAGHSKQTRLGLKLRLKNYEKPKRKGPVSSRPKQKQSHSQTKRPETEPVKIKRALSAGPLAEGYQESRAKKETPQPDNKPQEPRVSGPVDLQLEDQQVSVLWTANSDAESQTALIQQASTGSQSDKYSAESACQTESGRSIPREEHQSIAAEMHKQFGLKINALQQQLLRLQQEVAAKEKSIEQKAKVLKEAEVGKPGLRDFLKESKDLLAGIEKRMQDKKKKEQEDKLRTHLQNAKEEAEISGRYSDMTETEFIVVGEGFPVSLHVFHEYLGCLWKFVNSNYFYQILHGFNSSKDPAPATALRALRLGEEIMGLYNSAHTILPPSLFDEFEEAAIEPPSCEEEVELKELEHHHNRAMFDAFEEQVAKMRHRGGLLQVLGGKDLQLLVSVTNDEQIEAIFEKARKQVMACGQILCGIHVPGEATERRKLTVQTMMEEGRGESIKLRSYKKQRMQKFIASEQKQLQEDWWLQARYKEVEHLLNVGDSLLDDLLLQLRLEPLFR